MPIVIIIIITTIIIIVVVVIIIITITIMWYHSQVHSLVSTLRFLNIISMIKSRNMKWVGHVAPMGNIRN
jgi:hypothetical protein